MINYNVLNKQQSTVQTPSTGINYDVLNNNQQITPQSTISGGINYNVINPTVDKVSPIIETQPNIQIGEYQPTTTQQVSEDVYRPVREKIELSEQTKAKNEQLLKSDVGKRLRDPFYGLKVLTGREKPISEATGLSTQETMSKILQVQEAERISSPTRAGITEGLYLGGTEKTIREQMDKYAQAGITSEDVYRGEEITDTSKFQTGETIGKTARYVTSYLLLGGGVEGAFNPAKAMLASKVTGLTGSTAIGYATSVLAQEYAKDVVIGMPQYFMEAKNKGLEGTEIANYMAKESVRDFAMNLGMYGIGSFYKFLKQASSSELGAFGDKMVKSISKETGLPQEEVFNSLKADFEAKGINGKELDKAYNDAKKMVDLYGNTENFKADNLAVVNKIDDIKANLKQTRQSIADKLTDKPNYKELVPDADDLKQARDYLNEIKRDLKKPSSKPLPPNKFKYVVGEKLDIFGQTFEVTGTKNGNYILTDVYGVERVEAKNLLEQATTRYGGTGVSNVEIKLRQKVDELSNKIEVLKSSEVDKATRQKGLDAIEKEINAYNLEIKNVQNLTKLEKANLQTWWAKEQKKILQLQYKEKALMNAQRGAEREVKDIVFNKVKKLSKQSKANNLTAQSELAFRKITDVIDPKAKSISKATLNDTKLMKYMDEQLNSYDVDYKPNKFIEEKIERIGKISINDMTIDELSELNEVLDYIVHANKTAKTILNNSKVESLEEIAKEIKDNHKTTKPLQVDVKGKSRKKVDSIINLYFREGAYDPHVLFKMIGDKTENSKVYSLYKGFVDGNLERTKFLQDGNALLDNLGIKSFKDNNYVLPIKLDNADVPVNMTLGERISTYLNMKNTDNFASLTNGGGRVDSMTRTIPFTQNDFDNIVGTLTKEEKAFADGISTDFFNRYLKDGINSTSYDLDSIFLAKETNYFPKTTDSMHRSTDYTKFSRNATREGMSLLQARTGAEIPLVIRDVFDVIDNHLSLVSEYKGYAVPLRNAKLVLGNADVKMAINNAFDGRMKAPLDDLIKNLDGGNYINDVNEELIGKVITNAQTAALGVNPKVWLNQLASFFTAMTEIEPQYLVRAFGQQAPTVELMSKHSPILWERSLGMATRETAEAMSKGGKLAQLSVMPIQKFDMEVMKKIWGAVDIKLKDAIDTGQFKYAYGSDEFYDAVARETERIIQRTQPNYNSLFRSQAGRQRGAVGRLATMFSTQTNKNFNMVVDAYVDYQATGSAKSLMKAIPAVLASSVGIASLQTAQKKLRGRETDFVKDAVSSFARNVYIVNQIDSKLFQGYDVDNIAESSLNDFLDAMKTMVDPDAPFNEKMYKATDSIGKLFIGLPVRNTVNTLGDILTLSGQDVLKYRYDKIYNTFNNTEMYAKFYDAYEKDDDDFMYELLKDMKEKGIKFDNLKSSMKTRGINVNGLNRFRSFLN